MRAASSVDLPAFGSPTRPTSATVRSSTASRFSSPSSPPSAPFGTRSRRWRRRVPATTAPAAGELTARASRRPGRPAGRCSSLDQGNRDLDHGVTLPSAPVLALAARTTRSQPAGAGDRRATPGAPDPGRHLEHDVAAAAAVAPVRATRGLYGSRRIEDDEPWPPYPTGRTR